MRAKNSLELSRQGYELMDKKRNILIRELSNHIESARKIQGTIDAAYREAYAALQKANLQMGAGSVQLISRTIPLDDSVEIKTRSIMGTDIPLVRSNEHTSLKPVYAFYRTRDSLDEARQAFEKVKRLTLELSQIEITAHRLAENIQKTQKRANALKNITIPRTEALVRTISAALEEKEREEFTRLKVIKRQKEEAAGQGEI